MTMEISNSNVSDVDFEAIHKILLEMGDQLKLQDVDALHSLIEELENETNNKPQITMDILAPCLFQVPALEETTTTTAAPNFFLSMKEALNLVSFLVSSKETMYLKPASRAVKKESDSLALSSSASSNNNNMHVSVDFLMVIVSQLSGKDVEVSTNATKTLISCCKKLGPTLSDPAIIAAADSLNHQWGKRNQDKEASTICVRCASAIVDLITSVDAGTDFFVLDKAISCGAMTMIVNMMIYDADPLLQMSMLDLIENLSTRKPMQHNRSKWLYSDQVLLPLLKMAGFDNNNEASSSDDGGEQQQCDPDPILGGPSLRLLSYLCRLGQHDQLLFEVGGLKLLKGFHHAMRNFDSSGELNRLACVDAISSFASASPDALEMLLHDPRTKSKWLSLSVAQPKLKAAILASVAMVIDPSLLSGGGKDDNNTASINNDAKLSDSLALKLFMHVGASNNNKDTTELLLSFAKSTISEIRLGSYKLMTAVASKVRTGAQMMLLHTGFYEFLIARDDVENTSEGKIAKYGVVQAVFNSEAIGFLAENIVHRLEKILKQGPQYTEPIIHQVMTAE